MKKTFFLFLAFLGIVGIAIGVGIGHFSQNKPTREVLPAKQTVTKSPLPKTSPTATPVKETNKEFPYTLTIPSINLTVPVESVGMDEKGNMDTPKNADNVAWYNLGYKPGTQGNSVIAGHYDKEDGSPAAFWNLTKLTKGDKVILTGDSGVQQTFVVTAIENYPYDAFPLQTVFGTSDKKRLNFITCQGKWNDTTKNYSHRTVVFTELVE